MRRLWTIIGKLLLKLSSLIHTIQIRTKDSSTIEQTCRTHLALPLDQHTFGLAYCVKNIKVISTDHMNLIISLICYLSNIYTYLFECVGLWVCIFKLEVTHVCRMLCFMNMKLYRPHALSHYARPLSLHKFMYLHEIYF